MRLVAGWTGRQTAQEGVWHVPQRPGADARVVKAVKGHRNRDGVHRRVLAAHLERLGRAWIRSAVGESNADESLAWAQERQTGLRADRAIPAGPPAGSQFRATAGDSETARPAAVPG